MAVWHEAGKMQARFKQGGWDKNKPSLSCLCLASILAYPSALIWEKSWFMAFIYRFFFISTEGLAMHAVRKEAHL